ncbi:molybdate ABC transporter substrate-binding protein [Desulfotruncus alcoholivorax]|uniref:molybdate ABC transporter substrate-binding protein n=1 Tax=Desulfotruncus alcoholivorax TaxID=265477 RepID=UPI0003FB88EF|nr:molybdate ABC transporter substrate-binding protein [Desulfotruncus alcoholivorax]
MKKIVLTVVLAMLFIIAAGCGNTHKAQDQTGGNVNLTIAAAASLQDALKELADVYSKTHPDVTIDYNFASSGTLQKQIEEGAPVDLFLSAGQKQMDAVAEKNLIDPTTRKDLLGNEMVLIVPQNSKLTQFDELTGAGITKISIGTPETVPAGKYAKETLASLNLWDRLQPKLVLAKDVRQVLTYVETGNVDAGLVYKSDAMVGKNIKIAAIASADTHQPIVYPMAVIKSTKYPEQAKAFADFLASKEAAVSFKKYGFNPLL